jgi:hypothetical protein
MVGYHHSVGVRGDDRLRRGASIVTRSRKLGRSLWIALFKIALVAAILFAISRLDIINAATMARIFSHPVAAGIAIMALVAAICVSVMRWYLLLMIQGLSISLWRLSSITFASYFIGSTTLGSVGTDAMRLYYIGREKSDSRGQAYLSLVVDRLVGMTGLLLLGAVLFAMNFAEITRHPHMLGLVLFSAAMAAGIVLLAAGRIQPLRHGSRLARDPSGHNPHESAGQLLCSRRGHGDGREEAPRLHARLRGRPGACGLLVLAS